MPKSKMQRIKFLKSNVNFILLGIIRIGNHKWPPPPNFNFYDTVITYLLMAHPASWWIGHWQHIFNVFSVLLCDHNLPPPYASLCNILIKVLPPNKLLLKTKYTNLFAYLCHLLLIFCIYMQAVFCFTLHLSQ